jgi:hypothetical protein
MTNPTNIDGLPSYAGPVVGTEIMEIEPTPPTGTNSQMPLSALAAFI